MHMNACLLPRKKEETKLTVTNNGRCHVVTVTNLSFSRPRLKLSGGRTDTSPLADCDTVSIVNWVLAKARTALPQLYRVDLFETRGCGVLVSTGQDGPQLPL